MSKHGTPLGVQKKNYYLRAFLWGLCLATLIFLPWMIFNKGYFFAGIIEYFSMWGLLLNADVQAG